MNMNEIALASPGAEQELIVPEGTIATFDVAKGPLTALNLVNNGTIRLVSSDPTTKEAEIIAQSLSNFGAIESDLPTLTLRTGDIRGLKKGGQFTARDTIHIDTAGDLRVLGGILQADVLKITSCGKVAVRAYRIDAKVKVKAREVAIGANDGNLEILEQDISGDPIYWQGKDTNGGNMTISVTNMPGEDVSLFAVGNITVNGPIDTRGGDNQHPGRVRISAGCQKVAWHYDPENPDATDETNGRFECVDCSNLGFFGLEVIQPDLETNDKTVTTGDIFAKGLSVIGGVVQVGNLTVDNDNIPINFTGGASLFGTKSVTVGNATIVARNLDQGTVFKGQLSVTAGENITVANVDGSVFLTTTKSGAITCGNVDGELGSINILAGSDFDTGGGGGIAALQTVPNARIVAGNLKTTSQIRLMANGNIQAGTLTLDEWTGGPTGTHDVRLHANIKVDGVVPVFRAGGGTSNGTGVITNSGRTIYPGNIKAGAIAITNGIGDVDLVGNNIKCLPNQNGVPGLAVDAPGSELDSASGQIRVIGTISTDGNTSVPAGFVVLMGKQLRGNGATITARDQMNSPEETPPQVLIAVDRIELPGNLEVQCEGHKGTSVQVAPKGSEQLDIIQWPSIFPIVPNSLQPTARDLRVVGAGNLKLRSFSEAAKVMLSGDPLRLTSTGGTTVDCHGKDSLITIDHAGGSPGALSLAMANGPIILDASSFNPDEAGGSIDINANRFDNTATLFNMFATGNGTAKGGTVSVSVQSALNLQNATINAGGGSSGDGGTIDLSYRSQDPLVVKDALATSGSTVGGHITFTNRRAGTMDVEVLGNIDTFKFGTEDLTGSVTLVPQNLNNDVVSFEIGVTGTFKSVLNARGKSITVNAIPSIRMALDQVLATSGPLSVNAGNNNTLQTSTIETVPNALIRTNQADGNLTLKATRILIDDSSVTLRAEGNLLLDCADLRNSANIVGRTATVHLKNPNEAVVVSQFLNSGTIRANDLAANPGLSIQCDNRLTVVSGGGVLRGNNILIRPSGSALGDVQLNETQLLRQLTASGSCQIFANHFSVDSGQRLDLTVLDGTPARLQLGVLVVSNAGRILSSGDLTINTIPNEAGVGALGITGTGILQAETITLIAAGAVNAEQNRFRNNAGSPAKLTGQASLDWNVLAATGGIRLGQVVAGRALLAQTNTGALTVDPAADLSAVNNLSLFATSGTIDLGTGSSISGSKVFITRGPSFNRDDGTYDSTKITVVEAGNGQVYFNQGVTPIQGGNVVSATGDGVEVVFDAPAITLQGGVMVIAP